MRKLLLAAGLIAAATFSAAAQDLGGSYIVNGTNLDGSPYEGTAVIEITSNNTCRIEWVTGDTTASGICMRNGIALAAGYVLGELVGLVIYEIKDNGVLDGLWTVADTDGVGTEILTPH